MSKTRFKKGDRVEITGGMQGLGVCGEVFWKGPSRYGEGERLGVRGDDGDTYWVDDAEVDSTNNKPPPSPTFNKGDRVAFQDRGRQGFGTVFWTGQSRSGGGQRLGIRDEDSGGDDDVVWVDARCTQLADDAARSKVA